MSSAHRLHTHTPLSSMVKCIDTHYNNKFDVCVAVNAVHECLFKLIFE